MNENKFPTPEKIWEPKPYSGRQIRQFQKHISDKYNVKIDDYWDLHAWSVSHVSEYWAEMWTYLDVIFSEPYVNVYDKDSSMQHVSKTWFEGARLNYAENVLRYKDNHLALIVPGENRETTKYTYADVYRQTCRYSAALRKFGLKKGDVVLGYMSNREEAIFAMLAAISIGAIWGGVVPYFGVKAALKNMRETPPTFLFTVDQIIIEGKVIQNLKKLQEISRALTTLKKVVIVPSSPESLKLDITGIRNGCFLEEFLSAGSKDIKSVKDLEFEQVPFNHPVIIHYLRSSTKPTVLLHGCGLLLNIGANFGIQMDATRNSVYFFTDPPGWTEWAIFVTCLSRGLAVVVYDGDPYEVNDTYIWDLVDEFGITNFLLDGEVIKGFQKKMIIPTNQHDLSSLKVIWSTDSRLTDESYAFVFEKIKKDVLFGILYGFTEILGLCLTAEPTLPIYKREMAPPVLGLNIVCLDEAGNSVVGTAGDIVITTPLPCLPLGLFGDTDGSLYKEKYFNKYTSVYFSKDRGIINPSTKGFVLCGRIDDTITPPYVRYAPSEMYDVVNIFDEVQDSLCVGQYKDSGERAVLFIQMKPNHSFNEDFRLKVEDAIEEEISDLHIPELILEIKEIPRDFNGKKVELLVKQIINKQPYDISKVLNPDCLKIFKNYKELEL